MGIKQIEKLCVPLWVVSVVVAFRRPMSYQSQCWNAPRNRFFMCVWFVLLVFLHVPRFPILRILSSNLLDGTSGHRDCTVSHFTYLRCSYLCCFVSRSCCVHVWNYLKQWPVTKNEKLLVEGESTNQIGPIRVLICCQFCCFGKLGNSQTVMKVYDPGSGRYINNDQCYVTAFLGLHKYGLLNTKLLSLLLSFTPLFPQNSITLIKIGSIASMQKLKIDKI